MLAVLCLWNVVHVLSVQLDSTVTNRPIKRIAFGSCSNHRFPFDYWQNIIDVKPDVWLWTGDIVYGRTKHGTDLTTIRNNYQSLKHHVLYQEFLSTNAIIDGVYDDHDIGMNDADNRLHKNISKEAQQLLLDFLDVDKNHERRQRNGAYSVHKYNDILVILLDTRTHRSPTVIPSIGKYEYPAMALIASYIRWLTAYFGFVKNHNGIVLNNAQWKWFEEILKSSEFIQSKLVLIVSSTQVFTSNPYFESWGHFPSEKRKLLQLLSDHVTQNDDHPHVLFISGDVHHAELLYGNEAYGPLEVTSSGLTHSIGGLGRRVWTRIATQITDTYASRHRTKYLDENTQNVYYGRNFGVIDILDGNKYELNVIDADSGDVMISVPLNKDKKASLKSTLSEMLNDESKLHFPILYPFFGLEIMVPFIILVLLIGQMILHFIHRRNNKMISKND